MNLKSLILFTLGALLAFRAPAQEIRWQKVYGGDSTEFVILSSILVGNSLYISGS